MGHDLNGDQSQVVYGSVRGSVLFNVFVSYITEGCLFADDTNVCNREDVPWGIPNMKNDLAFLENWPKL